VLSLDWERIKLDKGKEDSRQDKPAAQRKLALPSHGKDRLARKGSTRFNIVGIGASAGALRACEKFFTNLPPDSGAAFVVVVHLDPKHSSIFVDLLQRYTQMSVFQVEKEIRVAPNCVYVIPPNADIAMLHGSLQLLPPVKIRGLHMPIDFFFQSLAEDQEANAVCIILSGTGTDGTLGLRAIKMGLGMVMVQDPITAEYDGMPKNALDTGLADYVLPVEEMPAQLLAYIKGFHRRKNSKVAAVHDKRSDSLDKVLGLINLRTGHDLSLYKKSTIYRRIERRMNVHKFDHISQYVDYLQNDADEVNALFKEILINVTSFFRDPEAFTFLAESVLPEMIVDKPEDYIVRVWAPGCSTGEEVYSLAIVLRECMDALKREFRVQIFGTDLDEDAILTARKGAYPLNINTDISPERMTSYFTREDNIYRVRKDIREVAVFAHHDIAKDPPFTRLDLICCRNLLIYLEAPLQKRILSLFHQLLKPGGILLLGTSETLGELAEYFTVVNQKWRISTRKEAPVLPIIIGGYPVPVYADTGQRASLFNAPERNNLSISRVLEKTLLEKYAPPSVAINNKGDIVYIHGRTGNFLEPAPGQPSLNIFNMAREGLRYELRSAVLQATAEKSVVVHEGVRTETDGSAELVKMTVEPIAGPKFLEGLMLVTFERQAPSGSSGAGGVDMAPQPGSAANDYVAKLDQELKQNRQLLYSSVKDMEASYQEVASTNEELMSTNEELQSSNEELETSKEEMQSLYEELMTVNNELQTNIDELSQANDDLKNFLNSTEIAAIFLDKDLKIRRFTPLATKMFNLIQVDVGRPLAHIVSNLAGVNVIEDTKEVLNTLVISYKEVQTADGLWYTMRIMPYRTLYNVVAGVVITFIDINEVKKALVQAIADARGFAQDIVATVHEPVLILDVDLKVMFASRDFFRVFKATPEDTEGKLVYELGNHQWDIPRLREMLEKVLASNSSFQEYRVEHDFPTIGHRVMLLNSCRINRVHVGIDMILVAIKEIR
jgi:two-component system CheB/CheR fusion protein